MKKIILGFFATIGFMVTLALGVFGFFIIKSHNLQPKLPEDILLTLTLQGDFPEYEQQQSFFGALTHGAFSHHELITTLNYAQEDPRVKGILLKVEHGFAGLAKSHEFLEALRRFRKTGKFVIAHTDTFGEMSNATGQYFLAVGADEIAMQPYGSVHLQGIGVDLPHTKKLLDTLKITPNFYKRSEYKAAFDTFTEEKITPANQEALTALLSSIFETLIKEIAHEREMSEQDIKALVEQAPIHSATKALQVGLIDHIYYYDQCLSYALKKAGKNSEKVSFYKYSHLVQATETKHHPHKVAIIFGEGEISSYPPNPAFLPMPVSDINFNAYSLDQTVEDILRNPEVKAVVLRLNTPGGSPTASESMWRHIQRLREKGLPVVISMSDYCASGGYYIASAADKIIANPLTVTGSIGAIGGKFAISDLLKALEIEVDSIRLGDQSLSASPFHNFSEKEWKSHKEAIDMVYYAFLAKVAEGRKMDLPHVASIAKGRPWSGEDALRLGLVDELGDLNKAIDVARNLAKIPSQEFVSIVPYPKAQGLFNRILTFMTGSPQEEQGLDAKSFSLKEPWLSLWATFMSYLGKTSSITVQSDVRIRS